MKTLLILANSSAFAPALRAVLDAQDYRLVPMETVLETESLLAGGMVDACLLDADLTDIAPIRVVHQLRSFNPDCPIIVFAAARQWEWEEEAYLLGVRHVLAKPIRGRLLNALLDRLWPSDARLPASRPASSHRSEPAVESSRKPVQTLKALRDFSAMLTHSLRTEALLNQFLLLLREILGVNRAAIFLRKPAGVFQKAVASEDRRLRAASAMGLAHGLFEHFELSLDRGLGGYACRHGRILRRDSEVVLQNREMQKEFELLGAQLAIPILDRESFLGVAVFDTRLTEEPFANEELALIFHLLEELGLAIKNSWLHDQLAANHAMMEDILSQLDSGCVVVDRNLDIVQANLAASRFFRPGRPAATRLEFSHLPQALGSKAFEVLKTGVPCLPFKCSLPDIPGAVFRVSIRPFKQLNSLTAHAVLLSLEDATQQERSQQLEIETSNLRMIKSMAEHLAHEIGNSLVPLSTHQQLLAEKREDPDFQASLAGAMAETVKRISRLAGQMILLAQDAAGPTALVPVRELIEEAFGEAKAYFAEGPASVQCGGEGMAMAIYANRAGLRHALAEVMLNALQADPLHPRVQVESVRETDGQGRPWLRLAIRDSGHGFTAETALQAQEPFFSTRTVGLGLGLTVARRIVEAHQGKINIPPSSPGQGGCVVCLLPLEALPEKGGSPSALSTWDKGTSRPLHS
ncbi:MAG: response regulator [Chloroflexi bacterium]|nr:response regulator [Chloroflexota bacterium]